jgi:hypothetical protein
MWVEKRAARPTICETRVVGRASVDPERSGMALDSITKAASMSCSLLALKIWSCNPSVRPRRDREVVLVRILRGSEKGTEAGPEPKDRGPGADPPAEGGSIQAVGRAEGDSRSDLQVQMRDRVGNPTPAPR